MCIDYDWHSDSYRGEKVSPREGRCAAAFRDGPLGRGILRSRFHHFVSALVRTVRPNFFPSPKGHGRCTRVFPAQVYQA